MKDAPVQSIRRLIRHSRYPVIPAQTAASPNQVIAYSRWSLRMLAVTGCGSGAAGSSLARDHQHRRLGPERRRHQRDVAGEPDVLLPVRRAGEAVGLLRPGERALDASSGRGGAARPLRRSARSRGRAGCAARPRAGRARSPGSRPPARAPRCRRAARPAPASPSARTRRYWSAAGVGSGGTSAGAAARRVSMRAMTAVLPGQALHLPDAEADQHRHAAEPEDQRADQPPHCRRPTGRALSRPAAPDVDGGEEEQPHHVDEVPVPGRRLEADMLVRGEVAEIDPQQADRRGRWCR